MLNGILLNDVLVLLRNPKSDNLLRLLAVALFHKDKMGKIDQKVRNILPQKELRYFSRLTVEMDHPLIDRLKRVRILPITDKNKMLRHGRAF